MNAEHFIDEWLRFIESDSWLVAKNWHATKEWATRAIGLAQYADSASPFGDHLVRAIGGEASYCKEEWNSDLVVSGSGQFTFDSIGQGPGPGWLFRRALYDIIIEHETNCLDSWQEMIKLIYMRAKLKVLISYNSDSDGTPSQEERVVGVERRVVEQFDSMIDASNQVHADNPATGYALILARLCNNQIIWKAWTRKSGHGAFKVVREWHRS